MGFAEILVRLHFHEAARGAVPFACGRGGAEQIERWCLRRNHKLNPPVIELIDQPGETPHAVGCTGGGKARHTVEDHRVKTARELDVVRLGSRPAA